MKLAKRVGSESFWFVFFRTCNRANKKFVPQKKNTVGTLAAQTTTHHDERQHPFDGADAAASHLHNGVI